MFLSWATTTPSDQLHQRGCRFLIDSIVRGQVAKKLQMDRAQLGSRGLAAILLPYGQQGGRITQLVLVAYSFGRELRRGTHLRATRPLQVERRSGHLPRLLRW